jgi:6-phosphogluconolactonase
MVYLFDLCMFLALLLPLLALPSLAFAPRTSGQQGQAFSYSSSRQESTLLRAAPAPNVWILPTEEDVTQAVHQIVQDAATKAIAERGHFALAIPGGSVLKVLSSMNVETDSWVDKTVLAYVNHKCVPNDDVSSAIHAKARSMFLDRWGLTNVITLEGTDDATKEASNYQAKLEALSQDVLPRNAEGFPVFDLCLIGIGDDGHIGSLYPNRNEIQEKKRWVTGVEMKSPPSITLTLPVMLAAKQSVVSAAGKSDKYPKGKASAMRLAMEDPEITPDQFPACAIRDKALWILDEPNASEMPSFPRSSLEQVMALI